MLLYGVKSFYFDITTNFDNMIKKAIKIVKQEKLAKPGENMVVTSSYPVSETGETNMMYIVTID